MALVLDVSRSASRVVSGRVTGIDRVEIAYINHFVKSSQPVYFMVRTGKQTIILDKAGMKKLFVLFENDGPWDKPDFISKLRRNKHHLSPQVQTTIRRLSVNWSYFKTGAIKPIPANSIYLNVGHGRLDAQMWENGKSGFGKIGFLIHDFIPLDYPEYTTERSQNTFSKQIYAALEAADFMICNSKYTEERALHWAKQWGISGFDTVVAPLGFEALPPPSEKSSAGNKPYFVALGTIEPRKNHRLLLDIWEKMHATLPEKDIPNLYIVGGRGWLNEDVFETLDTAPFMNNTVHELGRLSDQEVADLLYNSKGLLFPSKAEGFGLPVAEAISMGVPVLSAELPSIREIANDNACYLENNISDWIKAILDAKMRDKQHEKPITHLPTWEKHFDKISAYLNALKENP